MSVNSLPQSAEDCAEWMQENGYLKNKKCYFDVIEMIDKCIKENVNSARKSSATPAQNAASNRNATDYHQLLTDEFLEWQLGDSGNYSREDLFDAFNEIVDKAMNDAAAQKDAEIKKLRDVLERIAVIVGGKNNYCDDPEFEVIESIIDEALKSTAKQASE
jgi:hypothetical protein